MNADAVWSSIIAQLKENDKELTTVPSNNREPLWFNAYVENENLYVQNSIRNHPSTKMSQRRKISKKDFDALYLYYYRWANGERHLRQEVTALSRNTTYIFALILQFLNCQN